MQGEPKRVDGARAMARTIAGAVVAAGVLLVPATAHAAGLRELVAHRGHRLLVVFSRELSDLVENLLHALWAQMLGPDAGGAHACSGLELWDLAALLLVAALVFAVVRVRNRTSQRRLEVAHRMVEQGMEPPGELLGDTRAGDLRRGVVLVFAGLGLLVASWTGAGVDGAHAPPSSAGLIPGFIGLGYLVSHWLSRATTPFADGRVHDADSASGRPGRRPEAWRVAAAAARNERGDPGNKDWRGRFGGDDVD